MEKELNTNQEQLFALIESTPYEKLSSAEKSFVLNEISEQEYRLQHAILTKSDELDKNIPTPLPLVLEEKKSVLLTPVPLYQSLIGIAAAAVLLFFILPSGTKEIVTVTTPVAQVDTVYLEKQSIDTVVKIEYRDRIIEKKIKQPRTDYKNYVSIEKPPVDLGVGLPQTPDLSSASLVNKGVSANGDETLELIRNFRMSN